MQRYCERTNINAINPAPTPGASSSNPAELSIESLARSYGLGEEDEMGWLDDISDIQSVKQEFQAYVTEPQVPEIELLHYWKVSELFNIYLRQLLTCRDSLVMPSDVPYSLCHCNGLLTNSSLISLM